MKHDRTLGPLTREEFQACISAPYGGAAKIIRKHDPLYGIGPGEKIKFRVEGSGNLTGTAYVEASSQEEADALADELSSSDFDWDACDDFTVDSVEPCKP